MEKKALGFFQKNSYLWVRLVPLPLQNFQHKILNLKAMVSLQTLLQSLLQEHRKLAR